MNILKDQKKIIVFFHDAFFALITYPLALGIRFESFHTPDYKIANIFQVFAIVFLVKMAVFYIMGTHRGIWRFTSTKDLGLIIRTVVVAEVTCLLVLFFWTRLINIPRTSFFIDTILMIFFLGGTRLAYRIWRDGRHHSKGEKTIVLGGGNAGEQLIRDIVKEKSHAIVAILDDNPKTHKRTIHGVKIEGSIDLLPQMIEKTKATQVLIAIPSANSDQIRRMVDLCEGKNVIVKTLPSLKDIVHGKVHISQLRPINIEDLLGRQPVHLNVKSLGQMMTGKVIMVTGGGGSIGGELCKQILKFKPEKLIVLEMSEFNIYKTELELTEKFPSTTIIPIVADVRDINRVESVFKTYNPHLVFHAAAYKHVPMMEANPQEAVKTNIIGTQNLAILSSKYNVERFVLVSTDKAVNPTNVMGATKRVAEQICQSIQERQGNNTKYMVVRFGNVLGSAGSVIPRFLDQIKSGGPVTVTHKDITRYFMSIPEATQLIMQAGSLGDGGEIFILEMGEPIKIIDLAKKLIQLSANRPDEIQIKVTGLRPGEKLYEELLSDEENTLPTSHEMVRVACARIVSEQLEEGIQVFKEKDLSDDQVRKTLHDLVPEYLPYPQISEEADEESNEKSLH